MDEVLRRSTLAFYQAMEGCVSVCRKGGVSEREREEGALGLDEVVRRSTLAFYQVMGGAGLCAGKGE